MSDMGHAAYFKYWGKARKADAGGVPFHLLPFHCLDVASVASYWLETDSVVRRLFSLSTDSFMVTKSWMLFFIALHDLGKLDIRFQIKSPESLATLQPHHGALDILDIRPY